MIKTYQAATLSEFYEIISKVGGGRHGMLGHLWYRAHEYNNYFLLPSLYRNKFYDSNIGETYTQMDLKEDYRYQHIKSRAFHSVKTNPVYKSEWMEIYQHHLGCTRLMDWSESAQKALLFSLECFIDTRDDRELQYKRQHITPCIWILDPFKLNEKVYDYMANPLYGKAKTEFERALKGVVSYKKLQLELKQNKKIYFDSNDGDIDIRGILSLCVLEDYRNVLGGQIEERVKNFEFNPFYYMALRMFSDAFPFVIDDKDAKPIPPLAILHPYHSERIRSQRGVFTIFPNYVLKGSAEIQARKTNIDIRKMECQSYIEDCLSVIYILNPNKVAEELIISGGRRSELYPDIQTYKDVIETQQFYY